MASDFAAILEKMKNNTPLDAANVPSTPAPAPAPVSVPVPTPVPPAPPPVPVPTPAARQISIAKFQAYLAMEAEVLEKRQQAAQETIEAKAKELQGLRENMLVISGALQGVQHIKAYLDQQP